MMFIMIILLISLSACASVDEVISGRLDKVEYFLSKIPTHEGSEYYKMNPVNSNCHQVHYCITTKGRILGDTNACNKTCDCSCYSKERMFHSVESYQEFEILELRKQVENQHEALKVIVDALEYSNILINEKKAKKINIPFF